MCIFPSYSKTRVSARIDECGSGNVIETGTRKIAFETAEEIFSSTVFIWYIHDNMTISTYLAAKAHTITLHWTSWSPLYQLPLRFNVYFLYVPFHFIISTRFSFPHHIVMCSSWILFIERVSSVQQLSLTQKMWKVLR